MADKMCPLRSGDVTQPCVREKCQWWSSVHLPDKSIIYGCGGVSMERWHRSDKVEEAP